jgi:hypothetical protein
MSQWLSVKAKHLFSPLRYWLGLQLSKKTVRLGGGQDKPKELRPSHRPKPAI